MNINLTKLQNFFSKNKLLFGICIFYFVFRVINLTKLPIFNDEAIYLDWGYREIHKPGFLFYSLYDSKQPFLMWIFGIIESIVSDPLLGGRLVSVFCGLLTLSGLYKIGKEAINKNTGLLAAFFYTLIPLFAFYDRQALMESAIAAVGVWACFFTLRFIQTPSKKHAIVLGLILGLGFFIKSTSLIFIAAAILLSFYFLLKRKPFALIGIRLFQALLAFIAVDLLLLFQPSFWATFSSNNRYSFTLTELLHFPIQSWIENLKGFFFICFFYVTPLVFLSALFGLFVLAKRKELKDKFIVLWLTITVILDIFLIKGISGRYLVSYLPLFTVFASIGVLQFYEKAKKKVILLIVCIAIIPFLLATELILAPDTYILSLANISGIGETSYVNGFTSGYGLENIRNFLDDKSKNGHIVVAIAENAGNPESALLTYYENSDNVTVSYFDGREFGNQLDKFDCFTYPEPFYFVSRGEFLTNLNKFLMPIKKFPVRGSSEFIGIYSLKSPCKGQTVQINFQ